ncbi:hypothetical protein SNEBB_003555 [Seison nebaliae]|nr:hypothetical protein SNEBB_003555 [Seison nebaliae]
MTNPCMNGTTIIGHPTNFHLFIRCHNRQYFSFHRCRDGTYFNKNHLRCEHMNSWRICITQPCLNGGVCHNILFNQYQCECQLGFDGRNCEININDCHPKSCESSFDQCIDLINGFVCVRRTLILHPYITGYVQRRVLIGESSINLEESQCYKNSNETKHYLSFHHRFYYECGINKETIVRSCPVDEQWDDNQKECVGIRENMNIFCYPGENVVRKHWADETKFLFCTKSGRMVTGQCLPNQIFDERFNDCLNVKL